MGHRLTIKKSLLLLANHFETKLIPRVSLCYAQQKEGARILKANLDGTTFAYNYRMQPAHRVMYTT